MAGKAGCKSQKALDVDTRYREDFLDTMDGRTEVSRTLRQRLGQLTSDLGGLNNLSYQERSLCRRIIHLERQLDKKELSLAHNSPIDEQSYYTAINTLSSLFSKLGLKRRARTVSLSDYLKKDRSSPQPKEECP